MEADGGILARASQQVENLHGPLPRQIGVGNRHLARHQYICQQNVFVTKFRLRFEICETYTVDTAVYFLDNAPRRVSRARSGVVPIRAMSPPTRARQWP